MENNLKDLFQHEIQDMYSSEKLLLNAMKDMAEAASSSELKSAIRDHMSETENHIKRLSKVAESCGFSPEGVTCQATVGLVKEGKEHVEEFGGSPAGDAAIIASLQKCEHYEIANYGTAVTWAESLGFDEAAQILGQTLDEEEACDEKLTALAEHGVNATAQGSRAQAI